MKTDRRTKRTQTLLKDAFVSLLAEKKSNEITVKELCDIADINRGTFYLHYQDIYDLKQQIENDICMQITQIILAYAPSKDSIDSYDLFLELFRFTEKNAALFKAFLGPNGDISFLKKIQILFKERYLELLLQGREPQNIANLDYSYHFLASGYTGLVTIWLTSDNPPSIEEMAALINKMIYDGIPSLVSLL